MRKLSKEKTVDALESIGLNLVEYKRGPFGNGNVAIAKTKSGDGIRYWFPENSDIQISTDKKQGQALLRVTELPRETCSSPVGGKGINLIYPSQYNTK